MSNHDTAAFSRRRFVGTVCPMIAGGLAFPRSLLRAQQQGQAGFWSEFTPEEQRAVNGSVMAQDLTNFAGHELLCNPHFRREDPDFYRF